MKDFSMLPSSWDWSVSRAIAIVFILSSAISRWHPMFVSASAQVLATFDDQLFQEIQNEKLPVASDDETLKRMVRSSNATAFDPSTSKKITELEGKLNRQIPLYTAGGNLTLINITIRNTQKFINKLNISLHQVESQLNSSSEDGESDIYLSLKMTYENKLDHMCKRIEALQSLSKLVTGFHNFNNSIYKYANVSQEFNSTRNATLLDQSCTILKDINNMIKSETQEARILNNLLEFEDMAQYFKSKYNNKLRNTSYWNRHVETYTMKLEKCEDEQEYKNLADYRNALWKHVLAPVLVILFIIGFLSNSILLIIFLKVENIRSGPNTLVVTLAIADILNFLVNIPIFYATFMSDHWEVGQELCVLYRFSKQLCKYASVYIVVAISFQKYFALKGYLFTSLFRKFNNQAFIITSVWVICCLLTIPGVIKAGTYKQACLITDRDDKGYLRWYSMYEMFVLLVIPGFLIGVPSIVNAIRIVKSIKRIPGEGVGHDKRKKARQISSNILIALTVVFIISYIPITTYYVVHYWSKRGDFDKRTNYICFIIAYSLQFFNSCFNPVALCIVSRKYRGYFNKHILRRKQYMFPEQTTTFTKSTNSTLI